MVGGSITQNFLCKISFRNLQHENFPIYTSAIVSTGKTSLMSLNQFLNVFPVNIIAIDEIPYFLIAIMLLTFLTIHKVLTLFEKYSKSVEGLI